jgi:hypothetical protein
MVVVVVKETSQKLEDCTLLSLCIRILEVCMDAWSHRAVPFEKHGAGAVHHEANHALARAAALARVALGAERQVHLM